jgi:hypothetical protein
MNLRCEEKALSVTGEGLGAHGVVPPNVRDEESLLRYVHVLVNIILLCEMRNPCWVQRVCVSTVSFVGW